MDGALALDFSRDSKGQKVSIIKWIAVAVTLALVPPANAATVTVCDQTIQYTPSPSQPEDFNGIWVGHIIHSNILKTCMGFVVIGAESDGTISTIQAWSAAAGEGFNNRNRSGQMKRTFVNQGGGKFELKAPSVRFELVMTETRRRMVGYRTGENGRNDVVFDKR